MFVALVKKKNEPQKHSCRNRRTMWTLGDQLCLTEEIHVTIFDDEANYY